METVLLKRYAKYHGVDLGERDGVHAIGYLGAILRREGEPLDEARDRVVRELARIEDAEMLLRRADEAAKANAEVVASTDHPYPEACALRAFYGFDAKILFAMADIDHAKWTATATTSGAILEGVACAWPRGSNA